MGQSKRQHWAEVCIRGQVFDGEWESVEPMAMLLGADAWALFLPAA